MKRLLLLPLICLLATTVFAQNDLAPVSWKFGAEKTGENEFTVTFSADVEEVWVIYSQQLESDDGPIPTSFYYNDLNDLELLGTIKEVGKMEEEYVLKK